MEANPTTEERNWGMAAHLGALIAVAGLPFGHVIGPLFVLLMKGKESAFVREHARASLNYQISVSIYGLIAIIVAVVALLPFAFTVSETTPSHEAAFPVGFFAIWLAIIAIVLLILFGSIVFIIMGTIAASEGRPYQYPFAIRFLREPTTIAQ